MSLVFSLSPASDVPIYRQIVQHIRRAIAQGQLQRASNFPPSVSRRITRGQSEYGRTQLSGDDPRRPARKPERRRRVRRGTARQVFSDDERQRRLSHAAEQVLYEALLLDYTLPEVHATLDDQWKRLQTQLTARRKK